MDREENITNHQSPITNHQSPITNHQSPISDLGLGIQMGKDNLSLLEDQSPLRRSEIFAGS
ncbi:hypothetical protein HV198_09515 [Citrobacter freundii]|jgi:hypothetical protein|uniref:hypothetical protein n=1 Tax=Citrobacter freundii TaxID=546 RepID=UPI00117A7578|nr:hypothetical protein HV215_09515 [Citrobacter freundii]QLV38793.1 hypothetical protein HV198_09515 [Citrobacter freundii]